MSDPKRLAAPAVRCFHCGKGFSGHEPLSVNGQPYHKKCLPRIDHKAFQEGVEKIFRDLDRSPES